MTTATQTFTPGSGTFTAPATLLTGGVQVDVRGGSGFTFGGVQGDHRGRGGRIVQGVAISPSDFLTITVGEQGASNTGGTGFHAGGNSGFSTGDAGGAGAGGGSSAVQSSGGSVLVEAGGGGGQGGNNRASTVAGGAGGWFGPYPSQIGQGAFSQGGNGGGAKGGFGGAGGFDNATTGGSGGSGGSSGGNAGSNGGNSGGGGAGLGGAGGAPPDTNAGPGGGGGGGSVGGGGGGSGGSAGGNAGAGGGGGQGGHTHAPFGTPGLTVDYGGQLGDGVVIVTYTFADAPLDPTLLAPANGIALDGAAVGVTFKWGYNPGTDSGTQTAYALRIKTAGGSYHYWNGTNISSTTPVWNTSSAQQATIPASILSDPNTYSWSVATQESHYSLRGGFAPDMVFTSTAMPTVTISSPGATTQSATPVISWTETLGVGDSQINWRALVYTQAQTLAPGFIIGTTPAIWDSTLTSGAALSTGPIGTTLTNGATYVAYVQVTETGGVQSVWTSQTFTVQFDQPVTPAFTATPQSDPTTGLPENSLVLQAADNLLSTDDSSFELSIGTWFGETNCTVSQETSEFDDGTAGMQIHASSAANMKASTATGLSAYPVVASQVYSAMVFLRAAVTGRSCTLKVFWWQASGAASGVNASSTIQTGNDNAGGWTQLVGHATAPSDAAFASLEVTVTGPANNEVHNADEAGLFVGVTSTWALGGFVGNSTAEFQFSTDGGDTWTEVSGSPVAIDPVAQSASLLDTRAPLGIDVLYQARVLSSAYNQAVTSSWAQDDAQLPATQWWIQMPDNPALALGLHRAKALGASSPDGAQISIALQQTEVQGAFRPLGSSTAIVVAGDLWDEEFDLSCTFLSDAEWQAFQSIRVQQQTVLLRSDMDGAVYYARLGADRPQLVWRASDRTEATGVRQVTIHCTPAPAVA